MNSKEVIATLQEMIISFQYERYNAGRKGADMRNFYTRRVDALEYCIDILLAGSQMKPYDTIRNGDYSMGEACGNISATVADLMETLSPEMEGYGRLAAGLENIAAATAAVKDMGQAMEDRLMEYRNAIETLGFMRIREQ